ncbi:MAG: hypothetical protein JWN69_240 [Alphaproteobacteria bacterium]|jgi:hypothetical protein|nr:hypothetical protein [Alphaproteobacteria bacterium]
MPTRTRNPRHSDATHVGNIAALLATESVPPMTTTRWVARRKAQVVGAVQAGLLTIDEACRFYRLTLEEFLSWQRALNLFGVSGLKATNQRRAVRRDLTFWPSR